MKSNLESNFSNIVKGAGNYIASQYGEDSRIESASAANIVYNALRDRIGYDLQPSLNQHIPADMKNLFSVQYNNNLNKFEAVEAPLLKQMREYDKKPLEQMMKDLEKISKDNNQSTQIQNQASSELQRIRQVDANLKKYGTHITDVEKLLNGKISALNKALDEDAKKMADRIMDKDARKEAHKKNVPLIVLAAVGVVAAIGLLVGSIYLLRLSAIKQEAAVKIAYTYTNKFGKTMTGYRTDGTGDLALIGGVMGIYVSIFAIPGAIVGLVFSIIDNDDKAVKLDDLQAGLKVASTMTTAITEMSNSIKGIMSSDPSTTKAIKSLTEISEEVQKETKDLKETAQVKFSISIRDEEIVAQTTTPQEKRELDKAVRESTAHVKELSTGLQKHLSKFMEAEKVTEFLDKIQTAAKNHKASEMEVAR